MQTDKRRRLPMKHNSLHSHPIRPTSCVFYTTSSLQEQAVSRATYDVRGFSVDRHDVGVQHTQLFSWRFFNLVPHFHGPACAEEHTTRPNTVSHSNAFQLYPLTAPGHNCGDSTVIFNVSDSVRLAHFNAPCSSITPSAERGAETPSPSFLTSIIHAQTAFQRVYQMCPNSA